MRALCPKCVWVICCARTARRVVYTYQCWSREALLQNPICEMCEMLLAWCPGPFLSSPNTHTHTHISYSCVVDTHDSTNGGLWEDICGEQHVLCGGLHLCISRICAHTGPTFSWQTLSRRRSSPLNTHTHKHNPVQVCARYICD